MELSSVALPLMSSYIYCLANIYKARNTLSFWHFWAQKQRSFNDKCSKLFQKKWKVSASKWKKLIVTDFERAIISAIEKDFPESTHSGCYFHFTKSIYRKVQQLGMVKEYRKNSTVRSSFRKFMALAFVPENEVPCIMKLLSDLQTVFLVQQFPKIADFLKYFHRTWILTFEVSMWNVLGQIIP